MEKELVPFNRREHAFYVDLILLRNTMMNNMDAVKDRLKDTPGAWRDLKLMEKIAEKIQNILSLSIPPEKLLRYKKLVEHGRYYLDFQGPVPRKDYRLVDTRELTYLAEEAIKGKCALCMAEGREVKRCALREALLTIAIPSEIKQFGCEYRHAAAQLLEGKEVKL